MARPGVDGWDARELHDGSRLWLFQGVPPAAIRSIDLVAWGRHELAQANVSAPVEPAPGHDWSSLMTITQEGSACTYPGIALSEGGTIDLFETIILDCTGADLDEPMHIHVEGVVTRAGTHVAVPIVDVDHAFGRGPRIDLAIPASEPPPCDDPRCE